MAAITTSYFSDLGSIPLTCRLYSPTSVFLLIERGKNPKDNTPKSFKLFNGFEFVFLTAKDGAQMLCICFISLAESCAPFTQ